MDQWNITIIATFSMIADFSLITMMHNKPLQAALISYCALCGAWQNLFVVPEIAVKLSRSIK